MVAVITMIIRNQALRNRRGCLPTALREAMKEPEAGSAASPHLSASVVLPYNAVSSN